MATQYTQSRKVLLIKGTLADAWVNRLQSAVSKLGTLDIGGKSDTFSRMRQVRYDIVIVDEGQLLEAYDFIRQILRFSPGVRVIVVSESQDWQRARLAFQWGAADYILTSITTDDLQTVLREV